MNRIVLDASAILALITAEPGHETLTSELLDHAVASAVNLAEVQAKLVGRGWIPDDAWEDATSPVSEVIAFDAGQARIAGGLILHTRHLGLSLGDRACLALGAQLGLPIYTAQKAWKSVKAGVKIHAIR